MCLRNMTFASVTMVLATVPAANAQQPVFYSQWMHSDVARAWSQGFTGQGAKVTVIDTFQGGIKGSLTGQREWRSHGGWTSKQLELIAPAASVIKHQWTDKRLPQLASGFNILNLSYGMKQLTHVVDRGAYRTLDPMNQSIVDHARNGTAVVVKSAGNNGGRPVGVMSATHSDALSRALKGGQSVIFVGALNKHGPRAAGEKARMAAYSNVAGADKKVNSRFVVVGVAPSTGLQGTSFAAPQVSGYAAILHSKFQKASPTQISNQILATARRDTIADYSLHTHGQGEADLSRALAPRRIR